MSNISKILLVVGAAVLSFSAHGQIWVPVGSPDFSPGITEHTNMAIDTSGTPYVAFSDSIYGYAVSVMKYNGSSWVNVGSPGFSAGEADFLHMVINNSGTPYVVYTDWGNGGQATVMKYDGSSWVNVGSPGFSAGLALWNSIAIDTGGTPYVAYSDYSDTGKATVMKFNGSSWLPVGSPDFSAGLANYSSITINSSGTPYVIYSDTSLGDAAVVKKFNGSNWVTVGNITGLTTAGANFTSIVMGQNDTPYVAFTDYSISGGATVMKYDTGWTVVGSRGFSQSSSVFYTSIAMHPSLGGWIPYVAYEDYSDDLKATAMKYTDTGWAAAGIHGFSTGTAEFTSIAIDKNGILYVAYTDQGSRSAAFGPATVMKLDTSIPTGISSILELTRALIISPNPTTASFTLNISSPQTEEATIIITNMLGEKVKEFVSYTNTDIQIQLNEPPGVYFISAVMKGGTVTSKILLE